MTEPALPSLAARRGSGPPGDTHYPVAVTPEIEAQLAAGAVVAIGVSGGKDSGAVAIRMAEYLDGIGHTGPRLLIHSDLGRVEWRGSLPACERLARGIGWDLVVVRRKSGDLMSRWETRWESNVRRYASLSCVRLILPWSTPRMRFCTSELKTDIICAELTRRYPGRAILSITGIRRQESARRAKMPVCQVQAKLSRRGASGSAWNPIIDWSTEMVLTYLASRGEPLHEAYTRYGTSRVSCAFCIMGAIGDLRAAATCDHNHDIYRRMVDLETRSTFAFQGTRWLGDVAPHLLDSDARDRLAVAKVAAGVRIEAEARLPSHLLYTAGWPRSIPTRQEADLLAQVRLAVAASLGLKIEFTNPEQIVERYRELLFARYGFAELDPWMTTARARRA